MPLEMIAVMYGLFVGRTSMKLLIKVLVGLSSMSVIPIGEIMKVMVVPLEIIVVEVGVVEGLSLINLAVKKVVDSPFTPVLIAIELLQFW